jgi:FAD/FMN-containing dehydrogenase
VRIDAGTPLAYVYAALAAKGVALAAGSCPTVGITGLTLGGGVGVLSRAFGLTCDALSSVEIVTADGRRRLVDASTDADLFWALRGGGGGGLGAVIALTMAVRPAPTVHTFYFEWGFDRAVDVLDAWQRWVAGVDDRAWSTCKLLATPGRRLGEGHHLRHLDRPGPPGSTACSPRSCRHWHTAGQRPLHDELRRGDGVRGRLLRPGRRGVHERGPCPAASTGLRRHLLYRDAAAASRPLSRRRLPAPGPALDLSGAIEAGVSFDVLGGAVAKVAPDATAFPHRRALATVQYTATWRSGRLRRSTRTYAGSGRR